MNTNGLETTLRTLLRSANPEATRLLVVATESAEPSLRVGAVRALALRPDRAGHRALVERRVKLSPDAQAALLDVLNRSPLAESLVGMVSIATPRLARRAVQVAADGGVIDVLPAAVEAALWPQDVAPAIAADVLRLAVRLEAAIRDYDPSAAAKSESPPVDPAFPRRAAVNALTECLRRFSPEQPAELFEALLLLAPGDEPALWEAVRDRSHPAHEALLVALRTSASRGAIGLLARALSDPRTPESIVEIAAERADAAGLETLLQLVGFPIGLRVREGCRRVQDFAWLEPTRQGVLLGLSGAAQAAAMAVAAASAAPRRRVSEALCAVIANGSPEGRLAATRAIESLPSFQAIEPLQAVLGGDDPEATAVAAGLLRRKDYPGAMGVLVQLLDHADNRVQAAAQRALRELTFFAFRDQLDELPPAEQSRVGRLVAKADPLAPASLQAELQAGAVSRRLGGLMLTELMGLVSEVAPALDRLLADPDSGVRSEAARLLSEAEPTRERIERLYQALRDPSSAVREAAEQTLAALNAVGNHEGVLL